MFRSFKPFFYRFRESDQTLSYAVIILLGVGIVNMYGVVGLDSPVFFKQSLFTIIGLAVMIFFSFFNYRYLKNYSSVVFILYLLSIILLGLTFYSQEVRGTNSWIILGGLTFEPAELTKICFIILIAKYFSQRHIHINQPRHVLISGTYFAIPVVVMINQSDLGSAIILGLLWLCLLLAVGINKKHLLILGFIGALLVYGSWTYVLKPYQKERITSFLNQDSDPYGSGYNLIQSKIAIGSGYWFGNGLGNGSQASLGFLPEPHNDFIFSAFIEQFGFFGGGFLLGIVGIIIHRILTIGSGSIHNFGKLFSVGLAVLISSHVVVSAGVNIGFLPVTGLPFTFLSSGGSHLVSVMAGLGILQSIKRYG